MPADIASSTAKCIRGLSIIGNISLGIDLLAGRKRVPNPATGITTFFIFFMCIKSTIGAK